jgi:hypothetical protein
MPEAAACLDYAPRQSVRHLRPVLILFAITSFAVVFAGLYAFEVADVRVWVDGNMMRSISFSRWYGWPDILKHIAVVAWYGIELLELLLFVAAILLVTSPRTGVRLSGVYARCAVVCCLVLASAEPIWWDALNRGGTEMVWYDEFPAMPIGRIVIVAGVCAVYPLLLLRILRTIRANTHSVSAPPHLFRRVMLSLTIPVALIPLAAVAGVRQYSRHVSAVAAGGGRASTQPLPRMPPIQSGRPVRGFEADELVGVVRKGPTICFSQGGYARYRNIYFDPAVGSVSALVFHQWWAVTIEFRLDSPDGRTIASLQTDDFPKMRMKDYKVPVSPIVTGIHDLYVVCETSAPYTELFEFTLRAGTATPPR